MFLSVRQNYFRDDYCYQLLGMFVSTFTGAVYVAQLHFNFISVKGIGTSSLQLSSTLLYAIVSLNNVVCVCTRRQRRDI